MEGDALKDFHVFLKEFQDETDRGAALLGCALIDQKLKETLLAFFADEAVGANLLDPLKHGPLAPMAARLNIALCLGLIDRDELRECKLIGIIRNAFAHWTHGTTFDHPEIAANCFKLRLVVPTNSPPIRKDPRSRFINSVFLTALGLSTRSIYAADLKRERILKTWPVIQLEAVAGSAPARPQNTEEQGGTGAGPTRIARS